MPKVLFCADDPGGANAIIPVIKRLQTKEKVLVLGARYAGAIFKRENIKFTDVSQLKLAALKSSILKFAPDCFVAGTSAGPSLDKKIFKFGRTLKVPTIAVVDFWSRYSERFSSVKKQLNLLPDKVCVVDQKMFNECLQVGIPKSNLVITGNPYLNQTIEKLKPVKKTKNQIIFISQPFKQLKTNEYYNEIQVVTDLLTYPRLNELPKIIIKLHPKESSKDYLKLFKKLKPVNVLLNATRDSRQLIRESRLILGMNSIMLLESSLAGIDTISYQPNLAPKLDILPSNRFGLSLACYDQAELYHKLDAWLSLEGKNPKNRSKLAKLKAQILPLNPVDKIIKLIYTSTASLYN